MVNPVVVLFSSLLLPPSQTFIKAQGDELRQFTPYYVGSRLVQGLDLPTQKVFTVNQGGIVGTASEVLFKLSGCAPGLKQAIQQVNPVLIHAQFGLSGALVLPLARSLQIPLLVHFRGADATVPATHARYASLNHWIYFQRLQQLKQEARLFLTVSKFIRKKLLDQGFSADRVIAHYHGVDTTRFQPDRTLPRQPIILFVGRLTEKKGCEYLIQATAQIQSVLPDVELVVIGDGPLRADLEAQAKLHLRRYQFLGTQPAPVVKEWMNRAKLLAAPSVTASQGDSEGLPNVVLEAQAMELPVISTLHAGIPEAVIHGKTGFLSPERDARSLAEQGLRLLQDAELWQHFSQNGRTHMVNHFNRSEQTKALEALYAAVTRGEL